MCQTAVNADKKLWMVEHTFRTATSILEVRPNYITIRLRRTDEMIRGHAF